MESENGNLNKDYARCVGVGLTSCPTLPDCCRDCKRYTPYASVPPDNDYWWVAVEYDPNTEDCYLHIPNSRMEDGRESQL